MPWIEPPPAECPLGHRLGPGQALLSWVACTCPDAMKAGTHGHRTVLCRQCEREGRSTVMYRPLHTGRQAR